MHALVTQGNDLSREGRWHEARSVFESAIMAGLGADAFEGLAEPSRWLNDMDGGIGSTAVGALGHAEPCGAGVVKPLGNRKVEAHTGT